METKKLCPLNASSDEVLCCCQEKCSWWDEDAQACAVLVLTRTLKKVIRNVK